MTVRLDRELVERGLARSRTQAQAAVRDGRVTVNGRVAERVSQAVAAGDRIAVSAAEPWVSRAANKLAGALAGSGVAVPGRVLDAGASTGGFTQVLLAGGATRVYAVDVGHGQLAPELRDDPRVVVHERTNLRELGLKHLEDAPVGLVVADVSFISLRLLLPRLLAVVEPGGSALLLVKPQFEVGRGGLDDSGVVRDPALRAAAVAGVVQAAAELGWSTVWQAPSVLPGESGNLEYFVHLVRAGLPLP